MIKENNIKLIFLSLSLLLIILIFSSFFWIITSSFKALKKLLLHLQLLSKNFTLEHYNKILFNSDFFIYLKIG